MHGNTPQPCQSRPGRPPALDKDYHYVKIYSREFLRAKRFRVCSPTLNHSNPLNLLLPLHTRTPHATKLVNGMVHHWRAFTGTDSLPRIHWHACATSTVQSQSMVTVNQANAHNLQRSCQHTSDQPSKRSRSTTVLPTYGAGQWSWSIKQTLTVDQANAHGLQRSITQTLTVNGLSAANPLEAQWLMWAYEAHVDKRPIWAHEPTGRRWAHVRKQMQTKNKQNICEPTGPRWPQGARRP